MRNHKPICDCKVGPGKFEGEPALKFLAWELTRNRDGDAITGYGVSVWLRAPLNLNDDPAVVRAAREYGYCEKCVAEAGTDVEGGVEVHEHGGFVYCDVYPTRESFDKALAEAEEEDEQEEDEDRT